MRTPPMRKKPSSPAKPLIPVLRLTTTSQELRKRRKVTGCLGLRTMSVRSLLRKDKTKIRMNLLVYQKKVQLGKERKAARFIRFNALFAGMVEP